MKSLLTPAVVARQLGISPERVRQLDGTLKPKRTETGVRVYDQDVVDEFAGRRDALLSRKRSAA
jgi:DNA-binding transcriptional MerR regulator